MFVRWDDGTHGPVPLGRSLDSRNEGGPNVLFVTSFGPGAQSSGEGWTLRTVRRTGGTRRERSGTLVLVTGQDSPLVPVVLSSNIYGTYRGLHTTPGGCAVLATGPTLLGMTVKDGWGLGGS